MYKAKGVGSRVGGGGEWSGGPWWGENGDNCTCTTIKSKNKQIINCLHVKSTKKYEFSGGTGVHEYITSF